MEQYVSHKSIEYLPMKNMCVEPWAANETSFISNSCNSSDFPPNVRNSYTNLLSANHSHFPFIHIRIKRYHTRYEYDMNWNAKETINNEITKKLIDGNLSFCIPIQTTEEKKWLQDELWLIKCVYVNTLVCVCVLCTVRDGTMKIARTILANASGKLHTYRWVIYVYEFAVIRSRIKLS